MMARLRFAAISFVFPAADTRRWKAEPIAMLSIRETARAHPTALGGRYARKSCDGACEYLILTGIKS
jgi:hypothetical protein